MRTLERGTRKFFFFFRPAQPPGPNFDCMIFDVEKIVDVVELYCLKPGEDDRQILAESNLLAIVNRLEQFASTTDLIPASCRRTVVSRGHLSRLTLNTLLDGFTSFQ